MTDNIQQINSQFEENLGETGIVGRELSNIQPTAAEINHLWATYMAESIAVAMEKHMVAKAKDPDFRNVLQLALDLSSKNVSVLEDISSLSNIPFRMLSEKKMLMLVLPFYSTMRSR